MAADKTPDISALLVAWGDGDESAFKSLVTLVYPEMRRIARRHLAKRPDHTLESAALANEAYVKLLRARGLRLGNRGHFYAVCAQMIRRILVDHARSRRYAKHGGEAVQLTFDETVLGTKARGVEVLALDEALIALSKLDPRKALVVELRYFGGLSVEETAEVLNISAETVQRDWKLAKTWLFRELSTTANAPQTM